MHDLTEIVEKLNNWKMRSNNLNLPPKKENWGRIKVNINYCNSSLPVFFDYNNVL